MDADEQRVDADAIRGSGALVAGDELRAAVDGFDGRSVGALVLVRGRDDWWRLRAAEGGQNVALDDAVGVWLLGGDVLAIRRGSAETVIWDRDADDADAVVARRVEDRMGAGRAERALANLEMEVVA